MQLADLAESLFGEEWAGSVSRFTGSGLRNCQRAKAAAEAGVEERRADAILQALVRRLDSFAPAIEAALQPDPNPFSTTLLPDHAGIALTMDEATSTRLYKLLHRASGYRIEAVAEKLLLALAYDLRKARERLHMNEDRPAAPPAVAIRALWPLLLFQLKMLRTTCGYMATGFAEIALVDDFQDAVFSAIIEAYPDEDDVENLLAAWHELGVDPHDDGFDDRAFARAAWYLNLETSDRRRSTLMPLLESMTDLYATMDSEVDDGRPSIAELGLWLGEWPEKDF